jgi:hypothetical protein
MRNSLHTYGHGVVLCVVYRKNTANHFPKFLLLTCRAIKARREAYHSIIGEYLYPGLVIVWKIYPIGSQVLCKGVFLLQSHNFLEYLSIAGPTKHCGRIRDSKWQPQGSTTTTTSSLLLIRTPGPYLTYMKRNDRGREKEHDEAPDSSIS